MLCVEGVCTDSAKRRWLSLSHCYVASLMTLGHRLHHGGPTTTANTHVYPESCTAIRETCSSDQSKGTASEGSEVFDLASCRHMIGSQHSLISEENCASERCAMHRPGQLDLSDGLVKYDLPSSFRSRFHRRVPMAHAAGTPSFTKPVGLPAYVIVAITSS